MLGEIGFLPKVYFVKYICILHKWSCDLWSMNKLFYPVDSRCKGACAHLPTFAIYTATYLRSMYYSSDYCELSLCRVLNDVTSSRKRRRRGTCFIFLNCSLFCVSAHGEQFQVGESSQWKRRFHHGTVEIYVFKCILENTP